MGAGGCSERTQEPHSLTTLFLRTHTQRTRPRQVPTEVEAAGMSGGVPGKTGEKPKPGQTWKYLEWLHADTQTIRGGECPVGFAQPLTSPDAALGSRSGEGITSWVHTEADSRQLLMEGGRVQWGQLLPEPCWQQMHPGCSGRRGVYL